MNIKSVWPVLAFCLGNAPAQAQESKVCEIDIAPLIKRVVNENGIGLNPIYEEQISRSSPYYSDFYGLQLIRPTDRKEIRKDFPVCSETDSTLTVNLPEGTVTFFDRQHPQILGWTAPYPFLIFSGNNCMELIRSQKGFNCWLTDKHLQEKYLIANPHYQEELRVQERWESSSLHLLRDTLLEHDPHCVHLYMDRVHGDSVAFERFLSVLRTIEIAWIGIEMMDASLQDTVDTYIFSDSTSNAYLKAKDALYAYYSTGWIRHFNYTPKGFEENPFCRMLMELRKKRVKVYALEQADMMFLLFRNGETAFGGAARSVMWADRLPVTGRGLVFGGSAHFTSPKGINFQDFYHDRAPGQKIVLINATPYRSADENAEE